MTALPRLFIILALFLVSGIARAETFYRSYEGCSIFFEDEEYLSDFEWVARMLQINGLSNPDSLFFDALCDLAPGGRIVFERHPGAEAGSNAMFSTSRGRESFVRAVTVNGCEGELERWQNGTRYMSEARVDRACLSGGGHSRTIAEATCFRIRNEDARLACLNRPYETRNLNARAILL